MTLRIGTLVRFVKTDLWRIRGRDLPRSKFVLIRQLRIIVLTFRGLAEDQWQLRASALTYFSALGVVPALAMVFGIAKGFGFERNLERVLMEKLEGQEEIVTRIVQFSQGLLDNVKGGLIAGVGLLALFWIIIKLFSQIESAFNEIWGVKRGRSTVRKVTDYLAMMLIGPVLFLLASTVTVLITSGLKMVVEQISLLAVVSPHIFFLLNLLPYAVFWILFTLLYVFMPNTRVRFTSALVGGIIAGTVYQVFQWGYINFQFWVSRYNAIYGSFAALPLFFIWLHFSWLVVLLGAEIAFAHQNVDTYEFEQDCRTVSESFKKLLALRIAHFLIQAFETGDRAMTAEHISHTLEIPFILVNQILFELVASGVVSEVNPDGGERPVYQPGRDPDALTVKVVLDALSQRGSNDIPVAETEELHRLAKTLEAFDRMVEASSENRLLKEI